MSQFCLLRCVGISYIARCAKAAGWSSPARNPLTRKIPIPVGKKFAKRNKRPKDGPETNKTNQGAFMKSKFVGLLAVGLLVITAGDAKAYFLDTGIVSAPTDARSAYRAGEFELSSATTITSLSRWMQIDVAGLLAFQILSDASNLPDNVLFSTSPLAESQTGGAPAWIGVDGLNWSLGAGTYWFAVSQPGPGPAQILLPFCDTTADPGCVANPLANEAVYSFANNTWGTRSARGGWRINVPANVPEPGTLALLGLGLAGLGASRRRKTEATS